MIPPFSQKSDYGEIGWRIGSSSAASQSREGFSLSTEESRSTRGGRDNSAGLSARGCELECLREPLRSTEKKEI